MANDEKKMKSVTYAAIDIGSNAARLLVKRIKREGTEVKFSKEILLRVPLRLGFDVFKLGKISEKREKTCSSARLEPEERLLPPGPADLRGGAFGCRRRSARNATTRPQSA